MFGVGGLVGLGMASMLVLVARELGGTGASVDTLVMALFAAVSGAAAVGGFLTTNAMRRRAQVSENELRRLQLQVDADLSSEKVFLLRGGQLAPASPSTEFYLRTAPVAAADADTKQRLRAQLGQDTFRELAQHLKALAEEQQSFDFRATDAEGAETRFRGDPYGAHSVVRFLPEPRSPQGGGLKIIRDYPRMDDLADADAAAPRKNDAAAYAEILTQAFGQAPIGVAMFDSERRLVASNAAAQRLWRLSSEQMGRNVTLRAVLDALRAAGRAPERGDFNDWRDALLADPMAATKAEPVWHLSNGDALRVRAHRTQNDGFIAFISDETAVFGLEREVKTLTGVREATITAIEQGVAVIGPDQRLQLVNPAFLSMWSLDPAIEQGGADLDEIAAAASKTPRERALWERVRSLFGGPIGTRPNASFIHRRDEDSVVAIKVTPLPDGAVLIVCDDVSDAHRAESALMERNAALQGADQVKTEFLAATATLLRTPLNSVIGFAQMLGKSDLPPDQAEYVANILTPAQDLERLISEALDIGELEAGAATLFHQAVDMQALIVRVIEMLGPRATMKRAKILAPSRKDLAMVAGDERRLKQAVFGAGVAALAHADPNDALAMVVGSDGVQTALRIRLAKRGGWPEEETANGAEASPSQIRDEAALSMTRRLIEMHGGVLSTEKTKDAFQIQLLLPAAPKESPSAPAQLTNGADTPATPSATP
ncbi:MAG: PAS-domain containing protein [Rhodobacteraceae bacterium]|nr:PAS-domain containing protein [Paracoccaceae bacterium]